MILRELPFVKCSKEPSVYRRCIKRHLLVDAFYVDDLFITGSNVLHINEFKREMSAEFEMSDLGRLTYYLGIEVIQHQGGITLSQKSYAIKILEEAGMTSCNLAHTPMDSGLKLSKSEEERSIDATIYRRNIGCLSYLLHTRLDLSYCVGVLSRYMQDLKESHGAAMKQCLRYFQGTVGYGLTFGNTIERTTRLVGYSDSSHNVDQDDGKSTIIYHEFDSILAMVYKEF
ncbi:uncharacterized mitochondrial protein AtMg00810-like [Raphanus sativus]|uniref:Uncharacterized mitochondrial protein AtMg00810-like n=1 Tax=Raphanus sativus TaxID=3726 RepID=A0A9W3CBT2_RAPSA|nr:uncharacterized mitochondrial protein AtMg00810-like [Raphanus sativus]